jgi:hypothetical protein
MIDTNNLVTIMSDHANLRYFMTSQHLSDRQARWAAYLSSFHFVIRHIPGKMNPGDSPTRWPDFVPKDKESKIQPCLLLEEEGSLQLRSFTTNICNFT